MAKIKPTEAVQPTVDKPNIHIHENDYKEIRGLKLDEFVSVSATGKVVSLDKPTYGGSKYSARIEISDLQINPSKKQQQSNVSKIFGLKNIK